jgi:hypothetical protein
MFAAGLGCQIRVYYHIHLVKEYKYKRISTRHKELNLEYWIGYKFIISERF